MLKPSEQSTLRNHSHGRIDRNNSVLKVLAGLLVLSLLLACALPSRFIILNLSPSVAPGFYVAIGARPGAGQLVEFRLPRAFQDAYPQCAVCARSNTLILKPIAAGPGDHVDTTGSVLRINGITLAPIQTHDSQGRPLPVWRANRLLEHGEYFVFSGRVWNSLDSRYFGPIRDGDIVAVRAPLITWGPP